MERRASVILTVAALVLTLAGCASGLGGSSSSPDGGNEGWRFYPGPSENDDRVIVCWGDSLTQGVGADDALVSLADGEPYDTSYQSYPQVLSQLTGLDTYNFGVAGATSEEIAIMQGALSLKGAEEPGAAEDSEGETANDDDKETISHIDPMVIEQGQEHAGDILILEIGSNGGWDGDYQTLIDQYKAMIDYSGCKDYLILGDTDDPGTSVGDTNQEPFTEDYAPKETDWEAALRESFGDHFINMRVFLIKHGLQISGLEPTEQDFEDAQRGCISQQLRSDWTHLNARGYFAEAVAVYMRGIRLGYWNEGEGSIEVPEVQRECPASMEQSAP